MRHQVFGREVGLLDQRQGGCDHLAKVVRRNVGGHAHRNAARAVDQHVGEPCRQHRGFAVFAVVVVLIIDGVFFDVGQQKGRGLIHPHFGVAHRRRAIAIHRAEVALSVQQLEAHRERLRHAHQRVVNRGVAVRVVLAHGIADRPRRLAVGLVVAVAGLVHRKQNPAVHGFEAVAQVGDGAADDHAHRVVEVGRAHFAGDRDRLPGMAGASAFRYGRIVCVVSGFRGGVHVSSPCSAAARRRTC